jgi:hypothetical protein
MMEQRFVDFVNFCMHQLASQDVDPVYPVLSRLYELYREYHMMDEEGALWHTFLYVGYYSLPSATRAYALAPRPMRLTPAQATLPTGTERRGFRGGAITRHLSSLVYLLDRYGTLSNWLTQGFGPDKRANWHRLQVTLQVPWGNGRWAAYKTGEILQKVHGFPVQPTDMGHSFSTGPRHGLALFYREVPGNTADAIRTLDRQGEDLLQKLMAYGVEMGIEQLETMLCDFHALYKGRYYVGHDIDQLQEQIASSGLPTEQAWPLWKARRDALPHEYLGELHGWHGVDRARKKVYQQTGKVVIRG